MVDEDRETEYDLHTRGARWDKAMGGPGTALDNTAPLKPDTVLGSANSMQVGGTHYAKRDYQHWDFVVDAGLGYLSGNATKYASRWRDKNGIQDLEKCGHYIAKLRELKADGLHQYMKPNKMQRAAIDAFCAQLPASDAALVEFISYGKLRKAAAALEAILAFARAAPTGQSAAT